MVNIQIDVHFDHGNIDKTYHTEYIRFDFTQDTDQPFILNQGIMNMSNMDSTDTIGAYFIYNVGTLSIYNFSMTDLSRNHYNPNDLHSRHIIYQSGSLSRLNLEEVHLTGSYLAIYLVSGSATISNSSFQRSSQAITVLRSDGFDVKHSIISNCGLYYGPFTSDTDSLTAPVQIWNSDDVTIRNNIFWGFDPDGLVVIDSSSSILITDNGGVADFSN